MLQVGSHNYEIQTFTAIQLVECGSKMQIKIFARECPTFVTLLH